MRVTIDNPQIEQIIHNIAEDFRFSGEYEKYAQLFYAADSEKTMDKKMVDDMIEYIKNAKEQLQNDPVWQKQFLDENPQIQEQRMIETMQRVAKEYELLLGYLMMLNLKEA